MKPIKPALLASAAIIALLSLFPVITHATPDVARVAGDLRVDGIVFNQDGSNTQTKASPWSFLGFDIFYNGGNIGIGSANTPTAKLDVTGTVKATAFTGDGSGLTHVWKTGGNAGTTPGTHFIGTTDNTAMEIKVNNSRAIRIDPDPASPKITAGNPNNAASGTGSTVAGGGAVSMNCWNSVNKTNTASCLNNAGGGYAFVGGGYGNNANGISSTIGGGFSNSIGINATSATVSGGNGNTSNGFVSVVSGGNFNSANGNYDIVGGGYLNTASGFYSTVGGGDGNKATGFQSVVGGGTANTASGSASVVGGGSTNIASGIQSTVAGGGGNKAGGDYSFAAGRQAKIQDKSDALNSTGHQGTFLWADSSAPFFWSNTSNEFAARATGGFRFVTAVDGAGTPSKAFTINPSSGTVSINTAVTTEQLSIGGSGSALELGAGVAGKQTDAGKIAYQKFTQDSLELVGAGATDQVRKIKLFAEGGATFTGPAIFAGVVTAQSFVPPSSRRLKSNIQTIENALDKVTRLRGVSYDWKSDGRHDIGVIAEEVALVVPEVVYYEDNGIDTKGVDYGHLVGLLIEAVKTQKAENDVLKARLEQIEQLLDSK